VKKEQDAVNQSLQETIRKNEKEARVLRKEIAGMQAQAHSVEGRAWEAQSHVLVSELSQACSLIILSLALVCHLLRHEACPLRSAHRWRARVDSLHISPSLSPPPPLSLQELEARHYELTFEVDALKVSMPSSMP
jgi:hypothetical protein